jgi:hypothetical protein
MDSQATKKDEFRGQLFAWRLATAYEDSVYNGRACYRWANTPVDEIFVLAMDGDGQWKTLSTGWYAASECREALRVLVGPPPWEVAIMGSMTDDPIIPWTDKPIQPVADALKTVAGENHGQIEELRLQYDSLKRESPTTVEKIKALGERLASLSNEAEHGFAELSAIAIGLVEERDKWIADFRELNYRATRLQGEVDSLRDEMTQWVSEHAAMKGAMVAAQSRLLAIHTAAEKAERGAGTVPREETIRAAADVFRVIFADAEHGVNIPEVLECPYGEPMHDAGDGCPCCMEVEAWAGEIADDVIARVEDSSMADREEIRQTIFRCLQERRVYPRGGPKVNAEAGSVDSEPVPAKTMDEWSRMREYMQTGGVTEDRVREIIREEIANAVELHGGTVYQGREPTPEELEIAAKFPQDQSKPLKSIEELQALIALNIEGRRST